MRSRFLLRAAVPLAAVVAALGGGHDPAEGAFPGVPEELIYVSDRDGNPELYRMSPVGAHQQRLTASAAREAAPSWSSDRGDRFYFASDEGGSFAIYARRGDFPPGIVVDTPGDDRAPAHSSRPDRLAFEHRDGGGAGEVYLATFSERAVAVRNLTNNPADDGAPAWSSWRDYDPDLPPPPEPRCPLPAPRLAFHSNREGTYDIWVAAEDGSGPVRVTREPGHEFNPSWSPDCRFLAFERRLTGNYDIWVVELSSGRERRIAGGPAMETDPAWSPNGLALAFVGTATGNEEIYVVSLAGRDPLPVPGAVTNITASAGADYAPDWQPSLPVFSTGGTPTPPPPLPGGLPACTKRGDDGPNTLKGGGGRDVLCGGKGKDTLLGNGGADVLVGGLGKDTLAGGAGKDELRAKDGGFDVLDGGDGRDYARIDDPTLDPPRDVETYDR